MDFNQIVMLVVAIFFALGCLDRCLGNKFGLCAVFESGFSLMGVVALGIVGMICISPILAKALQPVVVPVYELLGADAAMFAPTFLSSDSGGYAIAAELGSDPRVIQFAGLIVGTLFGPIISFTIPVAVGMIRKEDTKYFATGIMAAFIAAPFGCLVGGLVYGLPLLTVARNLVPIFLFAAVIIVTLYLVPDVMIRIFSVFARVMTIITAGLGLAAFQTLTGITLLEGMGDINTGWATTGVVILIIAGAFPLEFVLERLLKKPLEAAGRALKLDSASVSGILISFVTALPAFGTYEKMNPRGKILVAAFAGTTAYLVGPHLGYVSAMDRELILPMFAAKCFAGLLAMAVALWFGRRVFKKEEELV